MNNQEQLFHEQAKVIQGIVYATESLPPETTIKELKKIIERGKE